MRVRATKVEVDRSMLPLTLVILGKIPSSKNRRRIVLGRNGRKMLIKSADAMAYEADFLCQVPRSAILGIGSKETPLRVSVTAFYPSWRSDLDCAIVYDLLQKAGIVSNDRWIRQKHEIAIVTQRLSPRAEIYIEWA